MAFAGTAMPDHPHGDPQSNNSRLGFGYWDAAMANASNVFVAPDSSSEVTDELMAVLASEVGNGAAMIGVIGALGLAAAALMTASALNLLGANWNTTGRIALTAAPLALTSGFLCRAAWQSRRRTNETDIEFLTRALEARRWAWWALGGLATVGLALITLRIVL